MKKTSTGSKVHRVEGIGLDVSVNTYEQPVYELNGITYVPHYRNSAIYVGPGYPRQNQNRFSVAELEMYGAKPRMMMLWARSTGGRVSDSEP
jgi:hypothetical protein